MFYLLNGVSLIGTFIAVFVVLPFHLEGSAIMDAKEFIESILNADRETINLVCQLLKVDPQLFESQDLLSGNDRIAV